MSDEMTVVHNHRHTSEEVVEVEAGELINAMRQHRRTVEMFQQSVARLDDSLASTMQFLSSWIDRLERHQHNERLAGR